MPRKSKITRNNLFYSESDFLFDSEIGNDYIKQDINQTIILFRVDQVLTNTSRWGETTEEGIIYKDPIELNCRYTIEKSTNKSHDVKQNLGSFQQKGNLKVGIYLQELEENNVEITNGDYIGIQIKPDQMEYWVVTKDGRVDFDNAHTMFGTKLLYRSIEATHTDPQEFTSK